MRLLELFSGTKSVGRAFAAHGFEVMSIDNVAALTPDICCDIMTWDYTIFPVGHFDVVWASPPCTQYSIARPKAKTPRDLEGADALVQRALDIIEYFQPRAWYLENPASGLLKTRRVIHGIPNVTVSYCRYGASYQKNTTLWVRYFTTLGDPYVASTARPSEATVHTENGLRRSPVEVRASLRYSCTRCPTRYAGTSCCPP